MVKRKVAREKIKKHNLISQKIILFLFVVLVVAASTAFALGGFSPNTKNKATQAPKTNQTWKQDRYTGGETYIGTYNGQKVIFSKYNSSADTSQSPGTGSGIIYYSTDKTKSLTNKALTELTDPIKILDEGTYDFYSTDNYFYVSAFTKDNKNYYRLDQTIYRIDKTTGAISDFWKTSVGDVDKYGGAGWGDMENADKNYLVLKLAGCFACDGGYIGKLLINSDNKKAVFIKNVGNVILDSSDKKYTYQKLSPVTRPCSESTPYCYNGQITTEEPLGKIYTASLP